MSNVKFYLGEDIPLELHKVRMVQKLYLVPIERRLEAIKDAGFNTFRLSTKDVYLDMLTDSGTNAMSDNQISAMLRADDAYAGSQSFERLQEAVEEVLGKKYLLPVHQGRAAENVISRTFIKPGNVIPMNYHFTTALAHILENGGKVAELLHDEALIRKPVQRQYGYREARSLHPGERRGEHSVYPHGGLDEPDRRAAFLDQQPDGRAPRGRQIRYYARARRQFAG